MFKHFRTGVFPQDLHQEIIGPKKPKKQNPSVKCLCSWYTLWQRACVFSLGHYGFDCQVSLHSKPALTRYCIFPK